jgi:putative DNA methylase
MTAPVTPFSLKDAPAVIERLLPVQKLSAEAYKEQMAVHGKTLTALGSYWKGRKPLILNKACILGCLLPASEEPSRDLEIFEKLMAMDDASLAKRLRLKAGQSLPLRPYRDLLRDAKRPEEISGMVHDHIWDEVNAHLGTSAHTFPELVEQLGVMRFGHRPRVGDPFCGSGQIPFEAARLGCDVYASDLNPVACMLTWGAFHIVGGSEQSRKQLAEAQQDLVRKVQAEIDRLGVETDGNSWRAKVFLYCVETRCPQTGWMVPLLPTRLVSKGYRVVAELLPDPVNKRYAIQIRSGVSEAEMEAAQTGTVGREGKYGEAYLIHQVDGVDYKTKISTLRGDCQKPDGSIGNRLRPWEKLDVVPRPDDLLQERLYCIEWMRPKGEGKGEEYEFRTVTDADLKRERIVRDFIADHLADWQTRGWVPDMRIEVGGPPRYQGLDLIRARGWMHWHHLFNPRQLLVAGLVNRLSDARLKVGLTQVLNTNSRLSRWNQSGGGGGIVAGVFDNQAINTLFNYGCRGSRYALDLTAVGKKFPFADSIRVVVDCQPADQLSTSNEIYVTDPPYGDAVMYHEITEFFIAWLRKNPALEFADWVWDSRRSLAIKGQGEDFRRGMVAAYKSMTERMPDNGIQVIMFTHQSGSIWADMANIVWASGLQVSAAWYVATEAEKRIQEGASHVKGTVLLVLRKRHGLRKTTRDDLAWEIQEEVEAQVQSLTGLNQQAKGLYRDENVFEDADIQMAGYAAALRVLTRYAIIDGRDMTAEAIRPRVKGQTTFVDGLITFAVDTANQCLVPQGIAKVHWDGLTGAERFYLKLIDLEAKGLETLDNYQNFAKAFKVGDFRALMASQKANAARLKSAVEFGKSEMSDGSELRESVLRASLYALMELVKNVDGAEVLAHLTLNVPDYYSNQTQRELVVELADYLAKKLGTLRPEEASAARVLRELVKNQRLG